MNEEFLQYAWKHQLFDRNGLQTTEGEPIEIINSGLWNTDSGPDFFNASLKIGDTIWAGNVEVHKKSSDWLKHNHQTDDSYNNVILHVVTENDAFITLPNGNALPVMVMKVDDNASLNYQHLLSEREMPACHNDLPMISPIYIRAALDAMLVDRLEEKTLEIEKTLARNKNDWNETFYQLLARNFGFKVNVLPFDMLARSLSIRVLAHHTNNLLQTEALLFGQSGLLNEQLLGDDYFLQLRDEYSFLSKKYGLKGIEGHVWKFMRLRPANFPSIRIAQFAALLHRSKSLLSKIIETESTQLLLEYFNVKASVYWDMHYRFNQPSEKSEKSLGKSSRNNILINTIVPFLYLYGERNNKPELKRRALDLLEIIPSEKNQIIALWEKLGIQSQNAYDSQALIQLKTRYCEHKKCLKCQIGARVIGIVS